MKNEISEKHHQEYVHMQCCANNIYDILLKIEFLDLMEIMKKYPMNHGLRIIQKISFFFQNFQFFIYEIDDEIIRNAYKSFESTYDDLIKLCASVEMLEDYSWILEKLKVLVSKYD